MDGYFGLDTSNYTTSAAVYTNKTVFQSKKLLPVKHGAQGLRQSDAVFLHTKQLAEMVQNIYKQFDGEVKAVGVSTRPRSIDGSYMPCFMVGSNAAHIMSSALHIPLYKFSHQQGHIIAALYSANRLELSKEKFLAFHISGGTTDALIVTPDNTNIITATQIATTLDLNAGQVVDRAGVMLDLDFPCGKELEKLALTYVGKLPKIKATLKGNDCCLSGAENKCQKLYKETNNMALVAAYALKYIEITISIMCSNILEEYGSMPVVFSGGVMSNSIIRKSLQQKFGAFFAQPEFSCDNAAGIAVLTALKSGAIRL